jgi:hypothetical protein
MKLGLKRGLQVLQMKTAHWQMTDPLQKRKSLKEKDLGCPRQGAERKFDQGTNWKSRSHCLVASMKHQENCPVTGSIPFSATEGCVYGG